MTQTIESLHEKISDIESKIQTHIAKLNRNDMLLEKAASFSDKILEFDKSLHDLEIRIGASIQQTVINSLDKLNGAYKNVSNELDKIKYSLKDFSSNSQIKQSIDAIKEELSVVIKSQISVENNLINYLTTQAFQDHKSFIIKEIECVSNKIPETLYKYAEVKTLISNLATTMKQDKDGINSLIRSLAISSDDTKKLFTSELTQLRNEISDKVNNSIQINSDNIKKEISTIPKPVIPSIDELKKSFTKDLEPVAVESRNANLRSSNVETKIMLLEKKLEQAMLLIQKLELSKS